MPKKNYQPLIASIFVSFANVVLKICIYESTTLLFMRGFIGNYKGNDTFQGFEWHLFTCFIQVWGLESNSSFVEGATPHIFL